MLYYILHKPALLAETIAYRRAFRSHFEKLNLRFTNSFSPSLSSQDQDLFLDQLNTPHILVIIQRPRSLYNLLDKKDMVYLNDQTEFINRPNGPENDIRIDFVFKESDITLSLHCLLLALV